VRACFDSPAASSLHRQCAAFFIAKPATFGYTTKLFFARLALEFCRVIVVTAKGDKQMPMSCRCIFLLVLSLVAAFAAPTAAEEAEAPVAPAPIDTVTLNDGSVLYGEVLEMDGGVLLLKNAANPDNMIKLKWDSVAKLAVTHPIPFHLKEGTILNGTTSEGPDGVLVIHADPLKGTMEVPMSDIKSVNPLVQPSVIYVGNLTGGFSRTTGNSHLRNASLLGELVARGDLLRLTMNVRYVYGDNAGALIARNARGTIKLDFFITKKLFWFTSAYFEQDSFQDLKLRTALATGPGYQWVDRGDYSGITKDMTLYTEAGLSYFNEDFTVAPDRSSVRARISVKWNWPMFEDAITLYHFSELFPSVQNTSDVYLTMDNGARFKVWKNFITSFQITTRYNSRPAPGTGDTDQLYLITLGYALDTTRKR
jgi:putative salt-induced outer membrane protein YdiY